MAKQLFGDRHPLGEPLTLNGVTFTVVGRLRRKDQDSSYSGPDNNKIFVPSCLRGADRGSAAW